MDSHDKNHGMQSPSLSVVVPIYNELKNIPILFERLTAALSSLPYQYEIIAVDDGSKDGSFNALKEVVQKDVRVVTLKFRTNFGQTAALAAGIEYARGGIIVTMDSDLENDPNDIPRLLMKLDEGYDIVCGWRQGRWRNAILTRRVPSQAANWLISYFSGVHLNDYGCTLRAYRAEYIKDVRLYGDMHRFMAAYAAWQGGRIAEIPVNHSPRVNGKSNYGTGRIFRVLFDLVVVVFMHRYMSRPMHFFGAWGFASLSLGLFAGLLAIFLRFFGLHLVQTPLPVFSALFIIVGVQLILFGVLAEILMRTYYESQDRRPYVIKEIVGSSR